MISHFECYSKTTSYDLSDMLKDRMWDFFISSYTDAERVQTVFANVNAKNKIWFKFSEYCYPDDHCIDNCAQFSTKDESEIIKVWEELGISKESSVCIDSTGFIRPYLAFLLRYLYQIGYKRIDVIYTEPISYGKKEKTEFSKGAIRVVRQIRGFEGEHEPDGDNDVLIINSGFDDKLITAVAENKKNTKKYQLVGFPSLRANMYQQGLLRVSKARESLDYAMPDSSRTILAPANDPFITAAALEAKVNEIHSANPIRNLYLSPLATKPQLIGLVLFYLLGEKPFPVSLIFPFADAYSKETGDGLARTWLYSLEFPSIDELRANHWL